LTLSAATQQMGAQSQGCAPILSATAPRIVFDTNVLLSLWVFSLSPAGSKFTPLRGLIETGKLLALSRPDCLAEFERVLGYPEFKLVPEKQRSIFEEYSSVAHLVPPVSAPDMPLPRCSDRDDQKFLELARDGAALALVTSDKALLRLARRKMLAGKFGILTPDQFLAGS